MVTEYVLCVFLPSFEVVCKFQTLPATLPVMYQPLLSNYCFRGRTPVIQIVTQNIVNKLLNTFIDISIIALSCITSHGTCGVTLGGLKFFRNIVIKFRETIRNAFTSCFRYASVLFQWTASDKVTKFLDNNFTNNNVIRQRDIACVYCKYENAYDGK